MAPKIAIVYYSTWGHIEKMAEAQAEGIKKAGGQATLLRIPETLPKEVLQKMHAGTPGNYDEATPDKLKDYDAFLFGIPTRYGNFPAQWKTFWDASGGLWAAGALWGKYAGVFVCTGGPGGGQESTVIASLSTLAHHGIIYVPLGYKTGGHIIADLTEVHGGSPWGSGSYSNSDGSRQPSAKELELCRIQGESFYNAVAKVNFGGDSSDATVPAKSAADGSAQK